MEDFQPKNWNFENVCLKFKLKHVAQFQLVVTNFHFAIVFKLYFDSAIDLNKAKRCNISVSEKPFGYP